MYSHSVPNCDKIDSRKELLKNVKLYFIHYPISTLIWTVFPVQAKKLYQKWSPPLGRYGNLIAMSTFCVLFHL